MALLCLVGMGRGVELLLGVSLVDCHVLCLCAMGFMCLPTYASCAAAAAAEVLEETQRCCYHSPGRCWVMKI